MNIYKKIFEGFKLLEANCTKPLCHVLNQVTMIFMGNEAVHTHVVQLS